MSKNCDCKFNSIISLLHIHDETVKFMSKLSVFA